jgi:hypothetical protein
MVVLTAPVGLPMAWRRRLHRHNHRNSHLLSFVLSFVVVPPLTELLTTPSSRCHEVRQLVDSGGCSCIEAAERANIELEMCGTFIKNNFESAGENRVPGGIVALS